MAVTAGTIGPCKHPHWFMQTHSPLFDTSRLFTHCTLQRKMLNLTCCWANFFFFSWKAGDNTCMERLFQVTKDTSTFLFLILKMILPLESHWWAYTYFLQVWQRLPKSQKICCCCCYCYILFRKMFLMLFQQKYISLDTKNMGWPELLQGVCSFPQAVKSEANSGTFILRNVTQYHCWFMQ